MAYGDFTLEQAGRLLGAPARLGALFPDCQPAEPSPWLRETLEKASQGSLLPLISEKARSEFIVAPILLAARELCNHRFSIYSGQRLDVDPARGLTGECDFILAGTEPVLPLRAPLMVVVEAKKNDIEAGLGQCMAQMVAAAAFNEAAGSAGRPVFGCVTSGEAWQFLKLEAGRTTIDNCRYYIGDVDKILGVLRSATAAAA